MGTSPDFEIALYTVCFFEASYCTCNINGKRLSITTINFNNKGNVLTAYPRVWVGWVLWRDCLWVSDQYWIKWRRNIVLLLSLLLLFCNSYLIYWLINYMWKPNSAKKLLYFLLYWKKRFVKFAECDWWTCLVRNHVAKFHCNMKTNVADIVKKARKNYKFHCLSAQLVTRVRGNKPDCGNE